MRFCVSLDEILAVFKPIVKATVHHYAGHVLAIEYQDPIVPDTDRVSDFFVCVPRNGFDDPGIQFRAEGAQAAVAVYI